MYTCRMQFTVKYNTYSKSAIILLILYREKLAVFIVDLFNDFSLQSFSLFL